MFEQVVISYTKLANPADVIGFVDVLTSTLLEEGSAPMVSCREVSPTLLCGSQFRVVWSGQIEFHSSDNQYQYQQQMGSVTVESKALNFDALMLLLAGRDKKQVTSYRDVLRSIYQVSEQIRTGVFTPSKEPAEYLNELLEAALNAFPKR